MATGGGLIAALKGRQRDFLESKIILLLPEETEMNIEDMRKLSTPELVKLYNEVAGASLKRFEDRQAAERRTAAALEKAGKLDKPMTQSEAANIAATAKASVKTGTPLTKLEPKKQKRGKPTVEASMKPSKAKAEAAAAKKSAKPKAEAKGRGAPKKNLTYTPISEKSKSFNPQKLRINPSSDRTKVYEFIIKKESATTDQINKHFDGQDINVASALYFLTKYGFVNAA